MQAPPTTSPALAQNTPAIDPETGLYELPLDADQSPTESVTAGSPSPIRISRSEPIRNPDMQVLNAWSAYQQGDYAAARILYQQFLARDPDNRDALLGVAATAMQQGDMISARQTYNHLLGLNPRDVLARTGLLETTSASDPVQRETELKTLQIDHPDIAAVSYSLGNLYAGQQRWHDAQQAYYEALLIARTQDEGAVSPDYAFNLAISLERINQPEAALTFYREARALAVQQVPGFDMATLDQRLRALERSQP
jgi:tetratricopeptide (TPR) repeat protein